MSVQRLPAAIFLATVLLGLLASCGADPSKGEAEGTDDTQAEAAPETDNTAAEATPTETADFVSPNDFRLQSKAYYVGLSMTYSEVGTYMFDVQNNKIVREMVTSLAEQSEKCVKDFSQPVDFQAGEKLRKATLQLGEFFAEHYVPLARRTLKTLEGGGEPSGDDLQQWETHNQYYTEYEEAYTTALKEFEEAHNLGG